MRLRVAAPLAAFGLLLTILVCATASQAAEESSPFVSAVASRSFTVEGTIVSIRDGSLVVRIDDHGHRIPFSLGPNVSADLRRGSRVSVRYHPSGDTGQVADEVRVLAGPRG